MERRAISISGIVQGVGLRPFVFGLASEFGLHGFVKNQTGGVLIEVEGEDRSVDGFFVALMKRPPPLAQFEEVSWTSCLPRNDTCFRIEASSADATSLIFPSPDVATCDDCLAELFDPGDRRYRYPFLNCTNCGPRFTIIRNAPYDRERTTMESFVMCAACRKEYEDPHNRRFHAEPIACAACGPRLQAVNAQGRSFASEDPLKAAVAALSQGKIVALKGLGGYHLACLAADETAVAELRRRKQRDAKPFALMVADLAGAHAIAEISTSEEALLESRRRPIVLLRRRPGADVAVAVAPGNHDLGVMLPYTPLHHLLLRALGATPLVMTSGNRSDEPIAYEDDDARERLAGIADLYLTHNRPIHMRCDDSVTRLVEGKELPLRRSRGHAPQPMSLPVACRRPTLALGGQLKTTFALGRGRHVVLSHHLGDLDHYEAYRAYVDAIAHYERLFAFQPELITHDLHPDYASTRYAAERAGEIPRVAVQHHHAHVASCMAEHGLNEPVIGVAFDGTGYGTDGAIWGGEFLTGDYLAFRRAAHLRYVAMPGGEQAIREPWRMAVAHLADAQPQDGSSWFARIPAPALHVVNQQLERRFNAPLTSSVGRLFDAVAALAGVRDHVCFEGQAAIELEQLASNVAADRAYPFEIEAGPSLVIDTRPLIAGVAADLRKGCAAAVIGRRFQTTLVEVIAAVCGRLAEENGPSTVVLSGGVFMNVLLTTETVARLTRDGFRVYRHQRVPPNDGGLCLGQLAVAAAWQEAGLVLG
ncbi:carbamoyltransferase HypF [Singulisphaera acidiphila]|uniref:Carbamoyltransferase n=1 Tax=Singulisphaera acidiphila (strain ATCC BAA-1392 / DSM 18658 / VKM B-2454 / MOB10) TaxID=886293 RepID=L0DJ29_SINAD|nr:carbamoyltransferase HypF [Singulisphaera acidiphila]AGA28676.1 (NiFe) hydrogenase maturation protein HypF [Singulisphaera acidiphila DSM 18658]